MNNGQAGIVGLGVGGGVCAPLPAFDVFEPLSKALYKRNRGGGIVLGPPILENAGVLRDAEGRYFAAPVPVFDTMTGANCIVGEQIAIVLGSSVVGDPDPFLTTDAILIQARAVVTFGLGDASFRAECDWIHGTQLTLTTETVTLQARYILQTDPAAALPEDLDLPSFQINAGVGRWAAGRNSNGARLTEIRHLDHSETKRIPIPPFAISLNVQPFGVAGNVRTTVRSFGAPYSTVYDKTSPLTGVQTENSLPIFGGGEFIEITNQDSQAAVRVAVIFGLAL